jgi:hypothetical protein
MKKKTTTKARKSNNTNAKALEAVKQLHAQCLRDTDTHIVSGSGEHDLTGTPSNILQFPVMFKKTVIMSVLCTKESVAMKRATEFFKRGGESAKSIQDAISIGDPIRKTTTPPKPEKAEPKQRGIGIVAMIDQLIIDGMNGTCDQLSSREIAEKVATKFDRDAESVLRTVRGRPYVLRNRGDIEDTPPFRSDAKEGVVSKIRELADGTRSCHEVAESLVELYGHKLKNAKTIVRSIVYGDKKKGLSTSLISEKDRIKALTEQLRCQEV